MGCLKLNTYTTLQIAHTSNTARSREVKSDAGTYKYKFQGQECQEELGLNWDSFKWRNYDKAIGRFMSVDPLTEKYHWMTPYQFSSNQVVHAPELEGLESANDLNYDEFTGSLVLENVSTDEGFNGDVLVDFTAIMIDKTIMSEEERWEQMQGENDGDYENGLSKSGDFNASEAKSGGGGMGTAILDGVQTGLDVVGLVPGFGEIADGVNALIYTGRGDYVNAGLSAAAMIPFAGWAATGGKFANKALKYHNRVDAATDLYHTFPRSFDSHIMQNGAWSQRIEDGANWFELSGTINGTNGMYQIGINNSNVIFHRNFVPFK